MNRFLTVSFSVLFLFFVLMPGVVADDSMFRADPQHTGVFDSGSMEPNNVLKWSFDEQSHRITSPAVAGGVVFFGSEDASLHALYTSNGTEKWNFSTGGMVRSAPAISEGVVYFGSVDGNIYALHATNGSQKWVVPGYEGFGYSSPVASGGTLYIVGYDRNLSAIDATTGIVRWKFPFVSPMGSETESSPAVADGVVFFGDLNRAVYAVWAANGTEKWRYTSPGTFMASIPPAAPVISGDILYMSGPGYRNLTALWAANGTMKWQVSRGYANWELVSPAINDGVLYTGGADQYLYALNASSGDQVWSFYLGSLLRASPSVSGDIVYAASMGKVLSAVYAGNSTEKWHFSPPNNKGLWGAPVVSDGVVYIDGDSADHLYAVGNQELPPRFFTGRVFAGETGNLTAIGLRDVPVRLFGSAVSGSPGILVTGTVTDSYGYYLLPVPAEPYEYLNIVHEDTVPGSNPVGARSGGGTVQNVSWIQYPAPAVSGTLTDNNFWDFVPTVHGNFTATPLSGTAPLTVAFTDDSTGFPVTWNWVHEYNTTIQNGLISGLSPNTTHTYTEPGVYSVQMRIFNAVSSDYVTKVEYITVEPPGNPVPGISGISPSHVVAGGSPFTLTVDGTNFIETSVIRSNGTDRATTFVSPARLTTVIPASDIAHPGTRNVSVFNPAPGGGISDNAMLIVSSPVLSVTSINPKAGARGKTVTVRNLSGTGYLTGATVNLTRAGKVITMKPVMVETPTKITGKIKIPARAKTGLWNVSVTNPDGQSVTLANGFRIRG